VQWHKTRFSGLKRSSVRRRLPPHNNALSPRGRRPLGGSVVLVRITALLGTPGTGVRLAVTAPGPAAVDLDAIPPARDAVPLAATDGRGRVGEAAQAAGAAGRVAAGAETATDGGRGRVGQVGVLFGGDGVFAVPGGELVDGGGCVVVHLTELAGGVRFGGFGVLDLGRRERATFGDVGAVPVRGAFAGRVG